MRYVIFGDGRAGKNIQSYLSSLGHQTDVIPHQMAQRARDICEGLIADADVVAAAIPDGKLQAWFKQWASAIGSRPAIHFSGASDIAGMWGYHPLYSFPPTVVDEKILAGIPFACPEGGPAFSEIFPKAQNPNFVLKASERARYHALAVISGNLAALLWNRTAGAFASLSGLPPDAMMGVYLQSLVDRFLESPSDSLTGPVARKDGETVRANLNSLSDDADLTKFYEALLSVGWPEYPHDS